MSDKPFYITTPIYYVNGHPHLGHAYTTIAADALARWHRLRGDRAFLLTGTDEHGQKVLDKARERGMSAQDHVDDMVVHWKAMMATLDIAHEHFLRTTDLPHVACVQAALAWLHGRTDAQGRPLLYQDRYVGWYSKSAERFWTEKDLVDGRCPDTGQPVERVEEVNWFFRMSSFQTALIDHIERHPAFIRPESRRNEILGFLRQPLGDLSISRPRARMSWGIPLPFDDASVTYVWFDALLNYVSATGWRPGMDTRAWDSLWPADIQLLGKDILTTHAVYWGTMLLALGLPLPRTLFAHGWWLDGDGRKMSKSVGNVIEPAVAIEGFGLDAFRFFVLREVALGADGRFSYDGFLVRTNADLSNDLGNLAHRALTMTTSWLGGGVPTVTPDASPTGFEAPLRALAADIVREVDAAWADVAPHTALDAVMRLARAGNKFLDDAKPWALNKAGDREATATVLRLTLEVAHLCVALLLPVLTRKAPELLAKLGTSEADAAVHVRGLLAGTATPLHALTAGASLTVGDPLFPRHKELPDAVVAALAAQPAPGIPDTPPPAPPPATAPPKPVVDMQAFAAIDLRAGIVRAARPHPNADRLLVVEVDIGEERPRTIVAGIAARFTPASLVGRQVVVVANLAPADLRGVTSEGMLLAAGGKQVVDLCAVDAPPGTVVR